MLDISNRGKMESLKRRLEGIVKSTSQLTNPTLSLAFRAMLAAISYADKTLMESSFNSLLEALSSTAQEIVQHEIRETDETMNALREFWRENVDGCPCENFDELGDAIGSLIDQRLSRMTRAREELVTPLAETNYGAANAAQLDDSIRSLQQFKQAIFKDWPFTKRPLPPVNRQSIAEARAAIARGAGGLRRSDLIWGKDPSTEQR